MEKFIYYNNKKIFYRIIGKGKPVIFIHGFGEDGNIWNSQAPSNSSQGGGPTITQPSLFENSLLISKFRFIIPDLPGSGKSEMIDDMSIEGMAEVIKTIIDTECSQVPPRGGFRGACLIGHSMGGYIALAFAKKYPDKLNALGLFHSTAYGDSMEKKSNRQKGIEFIRRHGAFEFLKTTIPNLFSQRSKDEMPQRIGEFIARQDNFSAEALVSYYEAMMQRPDRTDILQKATVPVLFIMGEYDYAIPLEESLKQCHLPEKSYIYILRKSGHMGMLEEPGKANTILYDFLQSLNDR